MSASKDDSTPVRCANVESVDELGTGVTSWAWRLGHTRYGQDEDAAQLAQAARATGLSMERWVTIVAAIRRLAEAYNAGARRMVLNVIEQSGEPAVGVAAEAEGATLEDTCICMRARDACGIPHAMVSGCVMTVVTMPQRPTSGKTGSSICNSSCE